jgi:hypothetical protein|tara:strand:- start:3192 stop:3839 length:648 start_codon:yes stop_codon:yes gene_type:complete
MKATIEESVTLLTNALIERHGQLKPTEINKQLRATIAEVLLENPELNEAGVAGWVVDKIANGLIQHKIVKEGKQKEADYIVDKVLTAIDAATSKKADYQFPATTESPHVKKLAKDLRKSKKEKGSKDSDDEALMNEIFNWLISGAERWGQGILQKRKGYLEKALYKDPKLKRMAKDFGLSDKEFEGKVYGLMKKDRRFLEDLASGKMRAKSAYRF